MEKLVRELIDFKEERISSVLFTLLQDRTTDQNIIFATDSYNKYGYAKTDHITEEIVYELQSVALQPRVCKSDDEKKKRTKKKAEVFTPTWICEKMNDLCVKECFTDWKKAVHSNTLEITCGEAPFLVSRYDTTSGDTIEIENRIGLLDRKLKYICDNVDDESDWLSHVEDAYKSTYGYEFQGDNLLIARVNFLLTFYEYYEYKFNKQAGSGYVNEIANIISWNLWQMDGLTDTVPFSETTNDDKQISLFGKSSKSMYCTIVDWETDSIIKFKDLKNNK